MPFQSARQLLQQGRSDATAARTTNDRDVQPAHVIGSTLASPAAKKNEVASGSTSRARGGRRAAAKADVAAGRQKTLASFACKAGSSDSSVARPVASPASAASSSSARLVSQQTDTSTADRSSQASVIGTDVVDVDDVIAGEDAEITLFSKLVGRQFHATGAEVLLMRARSCVDQNTADGVGACEPSSNVEAKLELVLQREPDNRYDANALLVVSSSSAGDVNCGHIPREHARVLAPLVDDGSITVSVFAEAHDVVQLPGGGALPLRLVVQVQASADAQSVGGMLQKLRERSTPKAEGVPNGGRPSASTTPNSAKRQATQRSLLMNFGCTPVGQAANMTITAKVPQQLGQYIVGNGLFSFVAVHMSVQAVAQASRASRAWQSAVKTLHQNGFRSAVEAYVGGHGLDHARVHRLCSSMSVGKLTSRDNDDDDDSSIIGSFKGLTSLLEIVVGWSSRVNALSVEEVVEVAKPTYPEHILRHFASCVGLQDIDGWPLLALALVIASTSGRARLVQEFVKIQGLNKLDAFRELISFLVTMCCCCMFIRGRENNAATSENSRRLPILMASRRLYADLLTANRFLEDAGIKFPLQGLTMPNIRLTEEQAGIVARDIQPSELLAISAFAGTGKTSTLRMYASLRPHLKFLYICFNVSVRQEAEKTFPDNVTCKNAHQLAFGACGFKYRAKLADDLRAEELLALPLFDALAPPSKTGAGSEKTRGDDGTETAQRYEIVEVCLQTLQSFLHSAARDISEEHLPRGVGIGVDASSRAGLSGVGVIEAARVLWYRMKNVADTSVRMTHNGYLKLYSLGKPQLAYDVVLLDEAQDCNPAIGDIVASQRCARILVGDKHQAIYGFLGAQDALKDATSKHNSSDDCQKTVVFKRQLTRSFRFGSNIADVANFVLGRFKNEPRPVLGCGSHEGVLLRDPRRGISEEGDLHLQGCPKPPFAYVARTNASVVSMALRAQEIGLELSWVGGVKGYRLDLLRDLCHLALGQRDQVESARIRTFASLNSLRAFARRVDDRELSERIDLVRRCQPSELLTRIGSLIAAAERQEAAISRKRGASIVKPVAVHLATVHKAKGLEWDTVVLAEDFPAPEDLLQNAGQDNAAGPDLGQEVNALYVALTRARKALQLPRPLAQAYAKDSECFAYVEPASVSEEAVCPWCGESTAVESRQHFERLDRAPTKVVAVGGVTLQRVCSSCVANASADGPALGIFSGEGDRGADGAGLRETPVEVIDLEA